MGGAGGQVDLEPPAQRIQAVRHAREALLGQDKRVDHPRPVQLRHPDLQELRVQEAEIERGVMCDQLIVAQELQQFPGDIGEDRLAHHVRAGHAVDTAGLGGNVALRVDHPMKERAGRQVVDQLQPGELDHPIAGQRIEAGGLGIEQYATAHERRLRISGSNWRSV